MRKLPSEREGLLAMVVRCKIWVGVDGWNQTMRTSSHRPRKAKGSLLPTYMSLVHFMIGNGEMIRFLHD